MQDFLFDLKFEVYAFTLILPDGKQINIEGNKLNQEAVMAVRKLKPKQEVIIDRIKYIINPEPAVDYKRVAPITVEIKD